MLPNGIPFVEAMAAAAKVGVATVTLNWHLRPDEVAWILDDSGARALVTEERLRPQVEAVAGERSVPVVWYGDGDPPGMTAAPPEPLPYRWPTSWPVLYTSGTSGRPKGVVHNAQAAPEIMEMTQDMLAGMWGYRPDDVHLAAGPLYHAGPSGYANVTLYLGGTVVLMESWDAARFLELVEAERVTTTFLTPAHMIRLLELPEDAWRAHDLTSLRHVIHAGAPCPVDVKHRFIEALPQAEVWELYGASEGGATRVSSAEWLERPGTVGLPWPGVRAAHPRRRGRRARAHGRGRRGVGRAAAGPVRVPQRSREDRGRRGGTARSRVGDIGHLDADGYLYLTDRLSDMLIRAGVNVYPREIEDVLHGHPDVVDCAVFGIPHDRDGEHPMAVVEVRGATTRRRAAGVVRRAARPVQGAHRLRADRRAPPRPERQGAQAPPPRPGLGRHRPRRSERARRRGGRHGARLIGGYSPDSGRYHFPLAPVCPYTGADDVQEVRLSRGRAALGLDRGHRRAARLRGPGALRLRRSWSSRPRRCGSSAG